MTTGNDSDSSFDEEYSIFSRPLKDLPIFQTLDLIDEVQQHPSFD